MQKIEDVWNKFATQDELAEAYIEQKTMFEDMSALINEFFDECDKFKEKLKDNEANNMQQQIIEHYGYENQAQKLIEELQELQHAIIYEGEEKVKEEMADVLNLIEQITHHKHWESDIYKIKYFKTQRQIERMKNEQ